MKTFDQLTDEQKADAISMAEYDLLDVIAKGIVEVELVEPRNQKKLQEILSEARKKESDRLVKLHILHDRPIRRELERLALVAAHGSVYYDNGEAVKEKKDENSGHIAGQQ